MNPLELLIVGLAASRITRLAVSDTITEPLRRKLWRVFPGRDVTFGDSEVRRDGTDMFGREVGWMGTREMFKTDGAWYAVHPSWVGDLISCAWCTGLWVGVAGFAAYWFYPVVVPYAAALAVAELIGLLNDRH